MSLPSIIKAEPDIATSCTVVTVSATLLLMSKYSIKKSNLSGLWVLGIGTFILNSSGENPVSIAGLRDKSLINHSPDSALICSIVSTLAVLSKLNFGVKVCSMVSKFCIPSISSSSCKTTGWPPSESDSSAPKYVCELNSFEVFILDPDKWKYSLPAFLTLPSITLDVVIPFTLAEMVYAELFLSVK